jgi:hypothetical protein
MVSPPTFAVEPQKDVASLRVRVNGNIVLGEADLHRMTFKTDAAAMAVFRKNVIPLRPGDNVQLQVEIVDIHGKGTDITRSANVTYESLSPWKLKVTSEGLITLAPDESFASGQINTMAGDTAVFISYQTGTLVVWNKVFISSAR